MNTMFSLLTLATIVITLLCSAAISALIVDFKTLRKKDKRQYAVVIPGSLIVTTLILEIMMFVKLGRFQFFPDAIINFFAIFVVVTIVSFILGFIMSFNLRANSNI